MKENERKRILCFSFRDDLNSIQHFKSLLSGSFSLPYYVMGIFSSSEQSTVNKMDDFALRESMV